MHEIARAIARLAREDRRYAPDAYFFVFDALAFAHQVLNFGSPADAEDLGTSGVTEEPARDPDQPERHVTGQELCEAIRRFALDQYGLMARTVFHHWGVRSTSDFGEIVFTLIRAGHMRKTPYDRREDFDDNFDFDDGLTRDYQISLPSS